jgi:general secretion pathway protein G
MKLPPTSQRKTNAASARTAFTLVELLVVIAIIVVLVSLLMVAVFKALDSAYEAQTRTDITQLAAAVQSFQTKYQVNYIPSRIVLCKQRVNYFNPVTGAYKSQLHQDSLEYLGRIWPRLNWSSPHPPVLPANVAWVGIDWSGDGQPPPAQASNLDPILEGEQCLVFFLGGIPSVGSGTMTGFSTNASDPSYHVYAIPPGDINPPLFEFKSNRLTQWPNTAPGFPSYLDGYGKTPYAYFSSYKSANGYNRYAGIPNPYIPLPNPPPPYPAQAYFSDCQALRSPPPIVLVPPIPPQPMGVWPYAQSWAPTIQYWNSQTFQIISAGKNLQFGLGTYPPGDPNYGAVSAVWAPSNAASFYQNGDNNSSNLGVWGYDDIGNFYDRLLGVPTQ